MIEKKRKEANKIPGVTLEKDRNIDNIFDLFNTYFFLNFKTP